MRKKDELSNSQSCLSKSILDEMLFVLCGRDVAAPATIRFWIEERLRLGLNKHGDTKLFEAEACAQIMEEDRKKSQANLQKDLERFGNKNMRCLICNMEMASIGHEMFHCAYCGCLKLPDKTPGDFVVPATALKKI